MAVRFFTLAVEQNFTKGRRTELVLSSCLYLTCKERDDLPLLLIDFSSYLRVDVYELASVYLQLCELLYIVENKNYEKLVDPSIFIPRFTNSLLKGTRNNDVVKTAKDIIASMKRDWIQTGRKPSGICGAALYTAALSHGIKCSKADIAKIVHMCEATLSKRLVEFGKTEAASLNADELSQREEELKELYKRSLTRRDNSENGKVLCKVCMHQDYKPFGYGLCKECYKEFVTVSGGVVGGLDPPAFQRAEKERMKKASSKEEEEEGEIGSLNNDERAPEYSEKGEGDKDGDDEALDESGNFSDINDDELDDYFQNEDERLLMKSAWELANPDYVDKEAAQEEASEAANGSNANCPEDARKLAEATKVAVTKSREEKKRKRAEEAKNAPPPATAMEAVRRMLDKKKLSRAFDEDVLDEMLDTSIVERSPKRLKTKTGLGGEDEGSESNEHENGENEYSD